MYRGPKMAGGENEIMGGISLMSVNCYLKKGILSSAQLGGRRLIHHDGLPELIQEKTSRGGQCHN